MHRVKDSGLTTASYNENASFSIVRVFLKTKSVMICNYHSIFRVNLQCFNVFSSYPAANVLDLSDDFLNILNSGRWIQ